jgi:hypothetical protein
MILGIGRDPSSLFSIARFRCSTHETLLVTLDNTQFLYGHIYGDYLLQFFQRFIAALSRPELMNVIDPVYSVFFINVAVRRLYTILGLRHKRHGTDEPLDLSGGKFSPLWDFIAAQTVTNHLNITAYEKFHLIKQSRPALVAAMGYPERSGAEVATVKPVSSKSKRRDSPSPSRAKSKVKRQPTPKVAPVQSEQPAPPASNSTKSSTTVSKRNQKHLCMFHLRHSLGVKKRNGSPSTECHWGTECSGDHDYEKWTKKDVLHAVRSVRDEAFRKALEEACKSKLH